MSISPPEPFDPVPPVDEPVLNVPLPPPLVGQGSPWQPANAENRDRILDWWRAWWREIFFPWLAAWRQWWWDQWLALIAWMNAWFAWIQDYVEEHATEGPPGPANELSIGDVTTLPTGDPASASVTGTPPSQILNLGLPRGEEGERGPAGVAEQRTSAWETATLGVGETAVIELDIERMTEWYKLYVSGAAWVRTYASLAQLNDDALRAQNQPIDIEIDHGCFLDYLAIASEQKVLTPAVTTTDVGLGIWLSVRNIGVAPAIITVTADYLIILED